MFGIITPITFTILAILSKYLCSPEVGFDDTNMSFSTYLFSNIVVLAVALPYWTYNKFSVYCFWTGFIASVLDTVGMVSMTKAYANGPTGPIGAILSICNIGLVIIEAIKYWRWLTKLETVGFLFGVFGSGILVVPDTYERYIFCCFFQKKFKK